LWNISVTLKAITIHCVVRLCLLGSLLPRVEAQQDTNDTCPGVIEAKLSTGRRIALDAPVELLLRPTPKNNHVDPVMVTFDPAPDFSVEPPAIRLEQSPSQAQQVRIVLKGPNPGLIRLKARATGWATSCPVLDLPLDVGFASVAHIKATIPELHASASELDTTGTVPLDGNTVKYFRLQLLDTSSKPLSVGSPVTVLLTAYEPVLSITGKTWTQTQPTLIAQDQSMSDLLLFRAPSWAQPQGVIKVELKKDSGSDDLMQTDLTYISKHAWWIYLLITIAGALVYSAVEALLGSGNDLKRFFEILFEGTGFKLVVALATGGLAYVLRETDTLGIKLDTSTTRGYFVLGLLFACFGIEAVFKKIRSKLEGQL